MKVSEFLRDIQSYYGQYSKGQLPYIVGYVKNKRENFLGALFTACIENFSSKWKVSPDIAIFKELEKEAYRIEEQQIPAPNEYVAIDEDCVDTEVAVDYLEKLYKKLMGKRSYYE